MSCECCRKESYPAHSPQNGSPHQGYVHVHMPRPRGNASSCCQHQHQHPHATSPHSHTPYHSQCTSLTPTTMNHPHHTHYQPLPQQNHHQQSGSSGQDYPYQHQYHHGICGSSQGSHCSHHDLPPPQVAACESSPPSHYRGGGVDTGHAHYYRQHQHLPTVASPLHMRHMAHGSPPEPFSTDTGSFHGATSGQHLTASDGHAHQLPSNFGVAPFRTPPPHGSQYAASSGCRHNDVAAQHNRGFLTPQPLSLSRGYNYHPRRELIPPPSQRTYPAADGGDMDHNAGQGSGAIPSPALNYVTSQQTTPPQLSQSLIRTPQREDMLSRNHSLTLDFSPGSDSDIPSTNKTYHTFQLAPHHSVALGPKDQSREDPLQPGNATFQDNEQSAKSVDMLKLLDKTPQVLVTPLTSTSAKNKVKFEEDTIVYTVGSEDEKFSDKVSFCVSSGGLKQERISSPPYITIPDEDPALSPFGPKFSINAHSSIKDVKLYPETIPSSSRYPTQRPPEIIPAHSKTIKDRPPHSKKHTKQQHQPFKSYPIRSRIKSNSDSRSDHAASSTVSSQSESDSELKVQPLRKKRLSHDRLKKKKRRNKIDNETESDVGSTDVDSNHKYLRKRRNKANGVDTDSDVGATGVDSNHGRLKIKGRDSTADIDSEVKSATKHDEICQQGGAAESWNHWESMARASMEMLGRDDGSNVAMEMVGNDNSSSVAMEMVGRDDDSSATTEMFGNVGCEDGSSVAMERVDNDNGSSVAMEILGRDDDSSVTTETFGHNEVSGGSSVAIEMIGHDDDSPVDVDTVDSDDGCSVDSAKDKKEVVLRDWFFKVSVNGTIFLYGNKDQDPSGTGLFWRSSPVSSRLSSHLLTTVTGTVYRLAGTLNKKEMSMDTEDYLILSKKIIKRFKNGFPPNWEELTSTAIADNSKDPPHTDPKQPPFTPEINSGTTLTSCPRTKEPNIKNEPQEIFETPTISTHHLDSSVKHSGFLSTLKQSSRGRTLKPSMYSLSPFLNSSSHIYSYDMHGDFQGISSPVIDLTLLENPVPVAKPRIKREEDDSSASDRHGFVKMKYRRKESPSSRTESELSASDSRSGESVKLMKSKIRKKRSTIIPRDLKKKVQCVVVKTEIHESSDTMDDQGRPQDMTVIVAKTKTSVEMTSTVPLTKTNRKSSRRRVKVSNFLQEDEYESERGNIVDEKVSAPSRSLSSLKTLGTSAKELKKRPRKSPKQTVRSDLLSESNLLSESDLLSESESESERANSRIEETFTTTKESKKTCKSSKQTLRRVTHTNLTSESECGSESDEIRDEESITASKVVTKELTKSAHASSKQAVRSRVTRSNMISESESESDRQSAGEEEFVTASKADKPGTKRRALKSSKRTRVTLSNLTSESECGSERDDTRDEESVAASKPDNSGTKKRALKLSKRTRVTLSNLTSESECGSERDDVRGEKSVAASKSDNSDRVEFKRIAHTSSKQTVRKSRVMRSNLTSESDCESERDDARANQSVAASISSLKASIRELKKRPRKSPKQTVVRSRVTHSIQKKVSVERIQDEGAAKDTSKRETFRVPKERPSHVRTSKVKDAKKGKYEEWCLQDDDKMSEAEKGGDLPWRDKDVKMLKRIVHTVPALTGNFWEVVSSKMSTGHSARECSTRFLQGTVKVNARKKTQQNTLDQDKKKVGGSRGRGVVTGKVGTLKRKREVRNTMEEMDKGYSDDIFDSTPFKKKKMKTVKIPDLSDDECFQPNEGQDSDDQVTESTATPVGDSWRRRLGAPISRTPKLCDFLSSPDLKSGLSRERETADHVMYQIQKAKKAPKPKSKVQAESVVLHSKETTKHSRQLLLEQKLRNIRTGELTTLHMFEDSDDDSSNSNPFSDADEAYQDIINRLH